MIFDEMEVKPKVRVANGMLLSGLALFNTDMRTLKREKVYQFTTPWIIDHSKYEQAFGVNVTPHPEAVKETVAWYREHPPT
jgi:hypothetical protein